jgi:hypothetical protein
MINGPGAFWRGRNWTQLGSWFISAGTPRFGFEITLTGCLVTIVLFLEVLFALVGGPWGDEFATWLFSDPSIALSDIVREWENESNPATFYLLIYAVRNLGSFDINQLRQLNLLPLLLVLAYAIYAYRQNPSERDFLLVSVCLFVSSSSFLRNYHDLRSYFFVFSAGFLLAMWTRRIAMFGSRVLCAWPDRMAMGAAIFVLANFHYMSGLFVVIAGAGVVLLQLGRLRACEYVLLTAFGAICMLPMVVLFILQLPHLAHTAENFWIDSTEGQAIKIVGKHLIADSGKNVVCYFALLLTYIKRPKFSINENENRYVRYCGFGVASFLGMLLIANLSTPIVIQRYLVPCSGFLIGALASLTCRYLTRSRLMFGLFCLNALATVALEKSHDWKNIGNWDTTAAAVASELRECTTSRVYAVLPESEYKNPIGYQYEAQRFKF